MNLPMMSLGTRGRHIFKFGVDFATTNDYSYFIQNLNGSYTYSNLTAFALDFSGNTTGAKNWNSYSQAFGNPAVSTRINDYDFYGEDQWRLTDKLTMNIGIRYESIHSFLSRRRATRSRPRHATSTHRLRILCCASDWHTG